MMVSSDLVRAWFRGGLVCSWHTIQEVEYFGKYQSKINKNNVLIPSVLWAWPRYGANAREQGKHSASWLDF